MKENNKENIISWQKYIATLSDDRFFDIMHAYIGEIKTPYNKQKLIERLGAFFHREQNRNTLIDLLDDFDKQIITAIKYIEDSTQENLISFFSDEYSYETIITRILNLTDRLIIFINCDDNKRFYLNPFLENIFEQFINVQYIIHPAKYASNENKINFSISPKFICAVISYILEKPELCKSDFSLRKNIKNQIDEIFLGNAQIFEIILKSFINLSLLKQTDRDIIIDYENIEEFSSLPEKLQYVYICICANKSLNKQTLNKYAQLILDCIASIPASGVTKQHLQRLALLLGYKENKLSNFRKMINAVQTGNTLEENENARESFDNIITTAEKLGLFVVAGKTEDGENIFIPNKLFYDFSDTEKQLGAKNCLSVDASFTVTLLPGLTLQELLPLSLFLKVLKCDTTVKFEINKNSVMRSFDFGYTVQTIYKLLEKNIVYDIPQNLRISLEDWQNTYSSAIIYNGYVLQLDEKNSQRLERNTLAQKYVKAKLADGIYFLNIKTDEDIIQFTNISGLNFIGKAKNIFEDNIKITFPKLSKGNNLFAEDFEKTICATTKNKSSEIIKSLRNELNKMNLQKMQKEGLENRINNKIILSPTQLNANTVRLENIEACGMDFSGKMHLIDNAISSKDMIELLIKSDKKLIKFETILCTPLYVSKKESLTTLFVQLEPSKKDFSIPVSIISNVKIIKKSSL